MCFRQSGKSIEIIQALWNPASEVDGIRRSQEQLFIQICVEKRLLHQSLTVVKDPIHFQSRDVLTQGGKLLFLKQADFPLREENDHLNAIRPQKSIAQRTSRFPR